VKLPFSPKKRKAVTLQLALEEGNRLEVTPRHLKDCITDEVKTNVIDFYNRNDISWAAPGQRDASTLRVTDGNKKSKIIIQKRFMMINVLEAYQIFKGENPNDKIGKSKFFQFRPKNIQNMADIPHNVCICRTHGNMDSLLIGISKVIPNVPSSSRALIENQVCQRDSPACMSRMCDECSELNWKQQMTAVKTKEL